MGSRAKPLNSHQTQHQAVFVQDLTNHSPSTFSRKVSHLIWALGYILMFKVYVRPRALPSMLWRAQNYKIRNYSVRLSSKPSQPKPSSEEKPPPPPPPTRLTFVPTSEWAPPRDPIHDSQKHKTERPRRQERSLRDHQKTSHHEGDHQYQNQNQNQNQNQRKKHRNHQKWTYSRTS